MLTDRTASRQAHLRSHSGRNAGVVFSHGIHRPSSLIQGSVAGALATSIALDGSNVQWMPRAAGGHVSGASDSYDIQENRYELIVSTSQRNQDFFFTVDMFVRNLDT